MNAAMRRLRRSATFLDHGSNKLRSSGFLTLCGDAMPDPLIIGIDEVGLGPCFGPLVLAAVCNPTGWFLPSITDSKKFTSQKAKRLRDQLAGEIKHACIWEAIFVSSQGINEHGTGVALRWANEHLAKKICERVRAAFPAFDLHVIFDGDEQPPSLPGVKTESIEKADAKIFEVSCASIVAKSLHDQMIRDMVASSEAYSRYDLLNNMGYPTPKHKAALIEHGLTDEHRVKACETLLADKDRDGEASATAGERRSRGTHGTHSPAAHGTLFSHR